MKIPGARWMAAVAVMSAQVAGAAPLATDSVPTEGRAAPKKVPSPEASVHEESQEQGPPPASAPAPTEALAPPSVGTPKLIEVYGFFLPSVQLSSGGLGTFGRTNLGAPTEAALGGRSRTSFQLQQSRFGANFNVSSEVRARLEVDFIDFTKASPTTQAYPRLRVLKVEYQALPNLLLFAGQDWDLFSPLNPYGYNFVGGMFRGGNAGFMRQQVGVGTKLFERIEAAASLGFGKPNTLENDQAAEVEKQPVYSAKVAYAQGSFRAGVSGIYSRYSYFTDTTAKTVSALGPAYAGNIFAEFTVLGIEARAEAYRGQNMAGINLLTIGLGTPGLPRVQETGGYLSAKYKVQRASFWTTLGTAAIEDARRVDATTKGTAGMRKNTVLKFGADYGLTEKLRAYYELSLFRTAYVAGEARESLHSVGLYLPL